MWSPSEEGQGDAPGQAAIRGECENTGPALVVLQQEMNFGELFPERSDTAAGRFESVTWGRIPSLPPIGEPWSALLCELPTEGFERARDFMVEWRTRYEVPLVSFSRHRHEEARRVAESLGVQAHLECPVPRQGLLELLAREREWLRVRRRWREARLQLWTEHRKLNVMREVSSAANSELNPDKVIQVVIEKARAILPFQTWSLFLMKEVENRLERWQGQEARATRSLYVSQIISRWVVRKQSALILTCEDGRIEGFSFWKNAVGPEVRSLLCLPLLSRGRIIGALQMVNRLGGQGFTNQDLDLVHSLLEPASIAIENALQVRRLEEQAVTDDLTGLYNSRYLHQVLHREVERARRYNHQVSLIFLDLDGFKEINDRHGHLAGSRALVEIGEVLAKTVRTIDVVSRFGGDEFTVILPETGVPGAATIAERIRTRIEEKTLLEDIGVRANVTASLGVATFPDHGHNKDELLAQADRAMYSVKGRNKNAVQVAA
jgi:diguanylate cyclase (GGDEF)-like protein